MNDQIREKLGINDIRDMDHIGSQHRNEKNNFFYHLISQKNVKN